MMPPPARSRSPTFSIIVPVYNVAPYLSECLDSMLAESYSDWEVIAVDDGSSDGSAARLDEYAARDARIQVVHAPHAGVSAARNRALDIARGEWIWFVDADDAIHPGALALAAAVLARTPDAAAYLLGTDSLRAEALPREWPLLPAAEQAEAINEHCALAMQAFRTGVSTCIIRRSLIGSLRFNVQRSIGEDVLFQLGFYWRTAKWVYLEAPLYFYRVRPGSAITARPSLKSVRDFLLTELELQALLDAHRSVWTQERNQEFFQWTRDLEWYTYRRMIFALGNADLRQVLPLWVQLQRWQHRVRGDTRFRRFVVAAVGLTHSPLLFRLLMGLQEFVVKHLRRAGAVASS